MDEMVIRAIEPRESDGHDQWHIYSSSGNLYIVAYEGCGDGDPEYVSVWSCTCPAYAYGTSKICKHIDAVVTWCDACDEEDD